MTITVKVRVNGSEHQFECGSGRLLIDAIRDELGLPGARAGCRTGDCGACTVVRDGELIKSCLTFAAAVDGCEITTIEGSHSRAMEALRQAFIEHHAFQCGFCTSGVLLVAEEFLKRVPQPTSREIRDALAGNICRCTGYDNIVEAIATAARRLMDGDIK
jgi:carbon-monoxide dehydrogenase small subunit